jgi:hypothetical protein
MAAVQSFWFYAFSSREPVAISLENGIPTRRFA